MKLWSRFAALLLLALWLPATLHCDLEAAEVEFLTHKDHTSSACRDTCTDDACHDIESGAFTKEVGTLRVLPPPELAQADFLLRLIAPPRLEEPPRIASGEQAPEWLVLRQTWRFVHRAALPARAPDAVA